MTKSHYVPNFLLPRFANEEGLLTVLDKETGGSWQKKGGGKVRFDLFAEHGFYSDDVEKALSRAEGDAAPVIANLIEGADRDEVPAYAQHEKAPLCWFLLLQTLRIQEVKKFLRLTGWRGPENPGNVYEEISTRAEDVLKGRDDAPERIELLRMMSMDVLVAKDRDDSPGYLVGDHPCLKNSAHRSLHPDMVVMPLSSRVTVQLCRYGTGNLCVESPPAAVEDANRQIYQHAHRFVAGPSNEVLQSAAARQPAKGN